MSTTELTDTEIEQLAEASEIDLDDVASCTLEKSEEHNESGAKIRCAVPEELWEYITDEPVKEVSFEVADTTEEESD